MTELMPYRPRAEVAVPAANDTDSWTHVLNEVAQLATQIANTPFVPDGLRGSVPATAAAILTGRELGLGPMTSLANIHVIKGKPALSAALMRALILAQGHQIETVDISDSRAVVRGRRRGESEWETASFTADQARTARIDLGGYPQDKLYARATSRLARRRFADVIAGMPYSAEELDDGITPDDTGTPAETATTPAIEAAKPRTAQRKQRTPSSPPAQAAAPAQAAPLSAGGDLPPLPGEDEGPTVAGPASGSASTGARASERTAPDETDYDTPGTATTPQITAIWTVFSNVYEFDKDEKDQARMVCAHIIGHDLASTKDLSRNEAKSILDTLSHWQHQAAEKGDHPREYMITVMVAEDNAVPSV